MGLVKIAEEKTTPKIRRGKKMPCQLIYRGRLNGDLGVGKRVPALGYMLRILRRVFGKGYITTNRVEGYFGRKKRRLQVHGTGKGTPNLVEGVGLLITKGGFMIQDAVRLTPFRVQGGRPCRESLQLPKLEVGGWYRVGYRGRYGGVTSRSVRVLEVLRFGSRRREQYVRVFCEFRNEERTFRLDCITSNHSTPLAGNIAPKACHKNLI